MSTTPVESWQNVNGAELGALYPGVGAEWILVIVAVLFWLWWHIAQMRAEGRTFREEQAKLKDGKTLERAMKGEKIS